MAIDNLISGCGSLILCSKTNRYLFLLRSNGKFADTWGIVGGKIEPNETILEGLNREIKEELGGSIREAKIYPIEKYTSTNEKFIYHTFLIKVDEEFIPELNNEHKGYCWVSLDHYPKPLHPGIIRILTNENVRQKVDTIENLKD